MALPLALMVFSDPFVVAMVSEGVSERPKNGIGANGIERDGPQQLRLFSFELFPKQKIFQALSTCPYMFEIPNRIPQTLDSVQRVSNVSQWSPLKHR